MPFTITLETQGRRFPCEANESVLSAGLKHGQLLPHACQSGHCGACLAQVHQGKVRWIRNPLYALSEKQKQEGQILLCSVAAESNLCIHTRTASKTPPPAQKRPCRVEAIRLIGDIAIVHLRLSPYHPMDFLAGQYINLILQDGRRRSFSLANAPKEKNLLELHIRLFADGYLSSYLRNTLKIGDVLRIEGPYGDFYWRPATERPSLLLAGGTGFAPIKSLIEQAAEQSPMRPIKLYWGAQTREGLYLHTLVQQWAGQWSSFSYVPVLAQPLAEDAWSGCEGLVHEKVLQDYPCLAGYQVYACGAPAMVQAARDKLIRQAQLAPEHFFSDIFVPASAQKDPSTPLP
jgi:CDP-4-dehydro-6-deoxyglucose reductase